MAGRELIGELDPRFSDGGASPTEWSTARDHLERAEVYWLTTVRPDGRPHVTTLIGVWLDDALYFCTGSGERKAQNLAHNRNCALTTGCNTLGEGLDLVVEGEAVRAQDDAELRVVAAAYAAKYGDDWAFEARDGTFHHDAGGSETPVWVYRVTPAKVLGFGKGESGSQTRWRF